MKPIYEQYWFCNLISWLNDHSEWFKKYGWGKSKNMEDFTRNPFEVLRDNYFPFCIKNVKPFSIFIFRMLYIPYSENKEHEYIKEVLTDNPNVKESEIIGTYHPVPIYYNDPNYKIKRISFGNGIFDLCMFNKWYSKYPNAGLMLQLAFSFKYYIIPFPWVSAGIRFSKKKYFQFGLGWGPQFENYDGSASLKYNASLSAKFRIADYAGELNWNPGSEVYGFWEGLV